MDISTLEYLEDRQLDRSSYSSNWSEREGSKLQGIHSYHILCNPKYKDAFHYISVKDRHENDDDFHCDGHDSQYSSFCSSQSEHVEESNAQNDLVKMALEFPFMSKKQQKMFEFSMEGYQKYLAANNQKLI